MVFIIKILVAFSVLLLLGACIFVHELGHFLAARWCGMVIETFSIGMGPALWKKKVNGVVYKLGCIPFGGYVALPQLDPTGMAMIQGDSEDGEPKPEDGKQEEEKDTEAEKAGAVNLPKIAPWKKVLVSLAGGVGNFILAIIIAWLVFWFGKPATPAETSSMIGYVAEGSEAWAQGLRMGHVVKTVNDESADSWQDVVIEAALANEVVLGTETPKGEEQIITIKTERSPMGHQAIPGVDGLSSCMVTNVVKGSSADEAGVQTNDYVLAINGISIMSSRHLIEIVEDNPEKTIPLKVLRGKEEVELTVTPKYIEKYDRAMIGIGFDRYAVLLNQRVHPKPMQQLKDHTMIIFKVLKALVTPKKAGHAARAVGGPVAILDTFWKLVLTDIMLAIWFTGLLNVNLAIINLLPFPVLDGGHIVFALWEAIFRKPIPAKIINFLVNVFVVLLLTVFVLLTYRDIRQRVAPGGFMDRQFAKVDSVFDEKQRPEICRQCLTKLVSGDAADLDCCPDSTLLVIKEEMADPENAEPEESAEEDDIAVPEPESAAP